jgi:hypothetical protein
VALALAANAPKADAATYGATTWNSIENSGTNLVVYHGQILDLNIANITANEIYSTLVRITAGTGNSQSNDFTILNNTANEQFFLSGDTATNGFWNGEKATTSPLSTYALTKRILF